MVTQRIKREDVMPVLSRFYAQVRRDPDLGPVPDDVLEDWAEHLQRLEDFWSSLMLASGRYKGNPVAMHVIHAHRIQPHMFSRWLGLWQVTTNDMVPPDVAREMQIKATRIADRLNRTINGSKAVIVACWPPDDPVIEPYRRTRIFDHKTVPPTLLGQHQTKDDAWAVVRIIDGQAVLHFEGAATQPITLDPQNLGFIEPCQPHHLELQGPVRFQLEFFNRDPRPLLNSNQQGRHYANCAQ